MKISPPNRIVSLAVVTLLSVPATALAQSQHNAAG